LNLSKAFSFGFRENDGGEDGSEDTEYSKSPKDIVVPDNGSKVAEEECYEEAQAPACRRHESGCKSW